MAGDPQNRQYVAGESKFLGGAVPQGTGAPGSAGATDADARPDRDYTTQATMPYQSVQNQDVPTVGAGADDTGTASQTAAYTSGNGFVAAGGSYGSTGAGEGATHVVHPNSTARP